MPGTKRSAQEQPKKLPRSKPDASKTIKNILKSHKLNDSNPDLQGQTSITEARFAELCLNALKKANPRASHFVLQYLANCKWRVYSNDNSVPPKPRKMQKTSKNQSDSDPIIKGPKKRKRIHEENETDDSEHNDLCEYCERPGELLLCDTCSGAYHLSCIKMEKSDLPDGEWSCPFCIEEELKMFQEVENVNKREKKVRVDTRNQFDCYHCGQPNGSIICTQCNKYFHPLCTFSSLKVESQEWKCQYCKAAPLEHQLERIIFWKYVEKKNIADPVEGEEKQVYRFKKFLVKYVDFSYWEVAWVDEFQIRVYSFPMYVAFTRKNDMNVPMLLDGGEAFPDNLDPVIDLQNITDADLYKTFFIYGIRPEWLQIQRILSVEKSTGNIFYLIKWRDLPYINCTWENRHTRYLRELCDMKKHIENFSGFVKEAIERPSIFAKAPIKPKYKPYPIPPPFLPLNDLSLHNYQLEGLNWIRYSYMNETNVILADEMGLGKTIQTITFLYSLYKEKISPGPFLVCAPLSTLPNWEREFEIWAPDFYVVMLNMSRENREFIKSEEFYLNRCSPKIPKASRKNLRFHVLLVSYEVAQIEASVLRPMHWNVLVLDEAHRIKNKQSKMHQNLADYHSRFKLLLTGTPLQNNLEELFYLLNFLSPKDFSKANDFLEEFRDLKKEEQIERIHKLLGKRLLRRLKSDVLKDIPVKSEVIVPVDLSPLQCKYYKAILNRNYSTLAQRGCTSSSLLNVLVELKKCCNHPFLFHLSKEEQPFNEETGTHSYLPLVEASSKMVLLEKMLFGLQKRGHRVLIFSQMTKLLDLLEDFLNHNNWKFERIDGSVPTLNRQASIDRFNAKDSQSFIFLLSTRAGGLGINLASADTVIIYDSDWNPHNDIQALSRAHRLGQLKKVMIYRFVTRNTVEERILEVAKKKMMLTHLVVSSGLGKRENISKRELDDILRFGTAQLFQNDGSSDLLQYDDKAIERLLDRNVHSTDVTESGINEYFSSFKVIDVAVRQPIEKDLTPNQTESCRYWESLLGDAHILTTEQTFDEFGKGKRQRKQVKYVDNEIRDENEFDPDYDAAKEVSSSSEDEATDKSSEETPHSAPKVVPKKDLWRIPLISSYTSNLSTESEFNRKKLILNKLALFGMPSTDIDYSFRKWGFDKEENFSLQDFKIYIRNTFASLDYSGSRFPPFSDKFPLDESGCQSILSRITLVELIKSKVLQYATYLPYMLAILIDEHLLTSEEIPENYLDQIKPFVEASNKPQLLSFNVRPPQNFKELSAKNAIFRFNIEDHNYTDLHLVWDAEQSIRVENLWWRYHDLWLLTGICVHGYNEFSSIFADPRFDLLHLAFLNSKEDKIGFARRRLDLLEQALVIEDVVRRMLEQRVYLRPESNIIKMRNKILELSSIIESAFPIVEGFVSKKASMTRPLNDVLNYCQFLCYDIKHDTSNLSRYILSSSLRSTQLFPSKTDDRFSIKLTTPVLPPMPKHVNINGS